MLINPNIATANEQGDGRQNVFQPVDAVSDSVTAPAASSANLSPLPHTSPCLFYCSQSAPGLCLGWRRSHPISPKSH